MEFTVIAAWVARAIVFGSVIMFGSIGEIITEKAGNLNLGTPGIMAMGGAAGFIAAFGYEQSAENPSAFVVVLLALFCSFAAGALAGLLYSFLTVTLRANQNVTGLTLTIFGVGAAKFFAAYAIPAGSVSTKATFAYGVFSTRIPWLSESLGKVSTLFFSYGFMMYLALILAILTTIVLNKTRVGLNLRAVGESPATADAAGINVTKYKYIAICLGSGISGLGGAYFILDYSTGVWSTQAGDAIESLGWLAVALVIFTTWKSVNAIWGAYLFGMCFWAYQFLPLQISPDLTQMLPYLVTIVVLVFVSFRKRREYQPPTSLGLPYFREER